MHCSTLEIVFVTSVATFTCISPNSFIQSHRMNCEESAQNLGDINKWGVSNNMLECKSACCFFSSFFSFQ